MSEEWEGRGLIGNPQNQHYYYGTFQGVANYYHPPSPQRPQPYPSVDFPQPVAPPGAASYPVYYPHGYQTVPAGYAVVEERPVRERRLPCCGLGMGWFLFMIGFFFGGIPWYIGTFVLLCVRVDNRDKAGYVACAIVVSYYFVRVDNRDKAGYVACAIVAILAKIAVTLGLTKGTHAW